jgi:hypothetical protein
VSLDTEGELSTALQREMPQRMLKSAVAYYQAGARCSKEPDLGTPGIVNCLFSIVYLKLLVLITQGKKVCGHDLAKLYDEELDDDARKKIAYSWELYGNWPSFENEDQAEQSFRNELKDATGLYNKWRYAFEHEYLLLYAENLPKLAKTLHMTVKEIASAALQVPDVPDERLT